MISENYLKMHNFNDINDYYHYIVLNHEKKYFVLIKNLIKKLSLKQYSDLLRYLKNKKYTIGKDGLLYKIQG